MKTDETIPSGSDKQYQYFTFFERLRELKNEETENIEIIETETKKDIFDYDRYRIAKPRRESIKLRILYDKGD